MVLGPLKGELSLLRVLRLNSSFIRGNLTRHERSLGSEYRFGRTITRNSLTHHLVPFPDLFENHFLVEGGRQLKRDYMYLAPILHINTI